MFVLKIIFEFIKLIVGITYNIPKHRALAGEFTEFSRK